MRTGLLQKKQSMKKYLTISNIISTVIIIGALAYIYDKTFNREPKFIIGEKAPDFSAKTPDGLDLNLSDYKGKLVLLDFWGTWCGPCLQEIPAMVQTYNTYKNQRFGKAEGFEILSVAMDKDKERWVQTIQNRGMNWKGHVSDLKRMQGPVGELYQIREIPTKYLINEKGIIISVDPMMEELNEILNKKAQE